MSDGTDVSSVRLRDSSALVLRGFELDLACPGEYENDSPVMWPHKLTLAIVGSTGTSTAVAAPCSIIAMRGT